MGQNEPSDGSEDEAPALGGPSGADGAEAESASGVERPGESERRRAAADEMVIEALATGSTYREAADLAGVSARTVRRRMEGVEFTARVARRRAEFLNTVTGRLAAMPDLAVDALQVALLAGTTTERLRAADMVLAQSRRFTADTDVSQRLVAVEARLLKGAGPGDDDD